MKTKSFALIAASVLAVSLSACAQLRNWMGQDQSAMQPAAGSAERSSVDKLLRQWPAGPQLAAQEMMAKYGPPQEATSERLIWHKAGPFKRIMLTKEELPHHFPITHKDYLEHTISYKVPTDKADEVLAFDSSITIYRVAGELSARCDLESNNVLTLNLVHDIVANNKSVGQARKEFGQAVMDRTLGKNPPITMALQFKPQSAQAAADTEKTTLPGSPQRAEAGSAAAGAGKASTDAEILAMVVALDENEVHAAMVAQEKKLTQPVLDYARMLHQAHGKSIQDTVMLGQKIGVTPMETAAVDKLHAKGAQGLAKVVPLNGEEFSRGFLDLMVSGHNEALQMLDQQIKAAQNEELKKHLTQTRQHVAMHLEQGKKLQASLKR